MRSAVGLHVACGAERAHTDADGHEKAEERDGNGNDARDDAGERSREAGESRGHGGNDGIHGKPPSKSIDVKQSEAVTDHSS